MVRKGERVQTLTKVVGQAPRTGIVVAVEDDEFVEVEWDDGHTSTVSAAAIVPAGAGEKKPRERSR